MQKDPSNDQRVYLSTEVAGRREVRFALAALLVSGVIFVAVAPFAKTPLTQVPAFIPIYTSTLVICDVITAVLLFGQFAFLRARALLALACGYLFTGSITASYALIFPGLFSPSGLFGAGPQTSSAMYMFWHGGFPLFVIGYALFKYRVTTANSRSAARRASPRLAIFSGIAVVLAVVFGFTLFATAGHDLLPVFLQGNRTTDLGRAVLAGVWILSSVALVVLWRRRPHTVIDLWLMIVMCVWLFDLALAAVLNSGRYDLGWYFGRIYGLLAASSLLAMLLVENGNYYARLVRMSEKLGIANETLEQLSLHDGLTALANRRFFDTYLAGQIAIARRHKRTLALVLCDVDAFKAYNDHYGHQAGDECLKKVAAALQSCCRRPSDMAARYGGEEFALIFPDTGLAGALVIAEAARDAVMQLSILHEHSPAGAIVSISGGVAVLLGTPDFGAEQLIMAADQTLLLAKTSGRNRMISAEAEVA